MTDGIASHAPSVGRPGGPALAQRRHGVLPAAGAHCSGTRHPPLAGEHGEGVVDGVAVEPQPSDRGVRRDVRRDDDPRVATQRVVGRERLGLGDVEPGAGEVTALERVEQGIVIDQTAAGAVDEERSGRHRRQCGRVDDVVRRRRRRRVQA